MNGNEAEMMGTLSLSYPLEDCEIGVPKKLTVEVMPTANDAKSGFVGDIISAPEYEHPTEESDEKMSKGMKGHAPAVAIVIASGKAKK